MKKRIVHVVFALILVLSLIPSAAADEQAEFSGTRTVKITADWSDLENYINGGRAVFEQILRSNIPPWLSYDIRTQGRDVTCTFQFSFTSLQEYQQRLTQLILRKPAMLYSQEDGLVFIESSTTFDLLNFLSAAMQAHNCLWERTFSEIFHASEGSIQINGKTYDITDGICIYPDNSETVTMSRLTVNTKTNKTYSFTRTLTAQVSSGNAAEILEERFSQVGNPKISRDGDFYHVTVSFQCVSQADLASKTMQCLLCPTFIDEQQSSESGKHVMVERTEYFDLDRLLEEAGSFSYSYTCPDYYDQLTAKSASATVRDNCVTAEDTSFIAFSYQRKLQFRTLSITTDLSSPHKKIHRSITCTVPLEIAEPFHKHITQRLERNLVNGSVMEIYDTEDSRCYQITFSSYLRREVEEFTASVLADSGYCFDPDFSIFPLGKNEIRESFQADKVISQTVPADEISVTYILPESARILESPNGEISGSSVTFRIRSMDAVDLSYQYISAISLVVPGVVMILLLILVAARKRSHCTKNRSTSRKTPCATPPEKLTYFCGNCGAPVSLEWRFCQECGSEIEL